jgi:hypothetical protein
MLEREGVPTDRGGVAPRPAIWVEGLGARFAAATALARAAAAPAVGEPGLATGLEADGDAGTGPRDALEGRFARAGEELAAGLEDGRTTGLGAEGTPDGRERLEPREAIEGEGFAAGFEDGRGAVGTLLVGLDPREAIEGDGFTAGLEDGLTAGFEEGRGAGREAIEGPRETLGERGGETRLMEGALGRGVTRDTEGAREMDGAREIDGARDGCRMTMGGREDIDGPLETPGRDIGALGREGIERGAEARGAKDWERPAEDPPPEFR